MKSLFFAAIIVSLSFFNTKSQVREDATVRVLTFNILHGATTEGDFDLDKIAEVIKQVDPDFVALQEVDFKTNRARNYDLATELGVRTQMAPLFGKAMDFDGGGYGEGILSKYPIIASRNVPLPHSPGNEPRAALEITVELPLGDTIQFIGTHLEHQQESSDRLYQVQKINNVFLENQFPSILAGDLNDTPKSKPIALLKKYWENASGENPEPTYPSENPKKTIDYIFYRPANSWQVISTKVICDTIASDHCAVFTVLKLTR